MSRPGDATVALRHSVVVTPLTEMRALRFSGPDARRALERLCAGTIRVRDGQLQHILLLHDDATPFADGFLLCDDDRYERGPRGRGRRHEPLARPLGTLHP